MVPTRYFFLLVTFCTVGKASCHQWNSIRIHKNFKSVFMIFIKVLMQIARHNRNRISLNTTLTELPIHVFPSPDLVWPTNLRSRQFNPSSVITFVAYDRILGTYFRLFLVQVGGSEWLCDSDDTGVGTYITLGTISSFIKRSLTRLSLT